MTDQRYQQLMASNGPWQGTNPDPVLDLTPTEISQGWHFCPDWDGLLISPEMPYEWSHCHCQNQTGKPEPATTPTIANCTGIFHGFWHTFPIPR